MNELETLATVSAASYLTPKAIEILEELLKESNRANVDFERGWLDDKLKEAYPQSTDGERTGTLNRLLKSDTRIKKLSRGNYVFSETMSLTFENVFEILDEAISKLDRLTVGLEIESGTTFTKKDRRLIQSAGESIDAIYDLKQQILDNIENDSKRYE